MRRLSPFVAAAVAAAVAPAAFAGHYYEADTTIAPVGKGHEQIVSVSGWVDGEKAKVEFLTDYAGGLIEKGSYLLSSDGGRTLFLVDPEKKRYSTWDVGSMLQVLGSGLGGLMKVDFSDVQGETQLREPGGELLGYPTEHVRRRTAYQLEIKILGFKQKRNVESVQDVWATDAIADQGMTVWLRNEPPSSGNKELDAVLSSALEAIAGFPLRSETTSTSRGDKGEPQVSKTTMAVTVLRDESVDPATFELPTDFEEAPLMPQLAGGTEGGSDKAESEGPLSGLKGLFGKKKKKDDGS